MPTHAARAGRPRAAWPARRPALATLLFFVGLTILHTWPLASAPGYWSRNDNGDAVLNAWAVAWVARTAFTDPRHLYDANIFHPERRTLAYSEHLVVQGVIAAPVVWLGGSAVLAFNVAMLTGFVLTGWAFCLVAQRWTGSWRAGLVAGSLAAFNSHTLMRLVHLQTLHVEFFALALLAMDRLLRAPRARHALLLGAAHALQGLAGVYLFVFTSCALVFAAAARWREWLPPARWRAAALLAVGVTVAALLLAPFFLEYARVSREMGFIRSLDEAYHYSASWRDYLISGSRLHWPAWSSRIGPWVSPNFPGFTALALAGLAVGSGLAWRDARARMALAVTLGCVLLSVAPRLPGYEQVYAIVPILRTVRVIARFGQIALVGVALLAGFGILWLERRWGARRGWVPAFLLVLGLITAEALRAPFWFQPFHGIAPIYDVLARERRAIVVELPLPSRPAFFHNAGYMLNSTRHWHPMINGYSGFVPPSYPRAHEALQRFPDAESLAFLRGLGVTHVVVNHHLTGDALRRPVSETPALEHVATDGPIEILRLRAR